LHSRTDSFVGIGLLTDDREQAKRIFCARHLDLKQNEERANIANEKIE